VWFDAIRLVGGLIVLGYAADRLVRSAVALSRAMGISAVMIGAVVIGFGTSMPELVVSGLAASAGDLDLAVANVIASNTANVTLVLGTAALISVLAARRRVIRREGVMMFVGVVVLTAALADQRLERWEGIVLLAMLGLAMTMIVRWSMGDSERTTPDSMDEPGDAPPMPRGIGFEIGIGVVALIATLVAADVLLDGVIGLGERFGLSVVFLGLITGVATSLPELAAAVASARHRQPELALGNVLGSNLFNSLGVIGFVALIGPGELHEITAVLVIAMVVAAAVAGVFALTGHRVSRAEGAVLIAGFVVYAVIAFV
jgi:cation:H+ antiporter